MNKKFHCLTCYYIYVISTGDIFNVDCDWDTAVPCKDHTTNRDLLRLS